MFTLIKIVGIKVIVAKDQQFLSMYTFWDPKDVHCHLINL